MDTQPIAHPNGYSAAVEASTKVLFSKWEARSRPRTEHPCRKIVFTIRSKDQGWGGERDSKGPYDKSYTWFDAGLERIEAIDMEKCTPEVQVPQYFTERFRLESHKDGSVTETPIACDLCTLRPVARDPAYSEFQHPFLPTATRLQSNVMAGREIKEHVITWKHDDCVVPDSPEGDKLEEEGRGRASATGEFVRKLKVGDIVTVWARARFPGWTNFVESVKVDVYWVI
jgi:hypothetical protein